MRQPAYCPPPREAYLYHANLVDPDMDISGSAEFGDYDDEMSGLSIVHNVYDLYEMFNDTN